MYVLLTDETNLEASDAVRFFTYGGLIVPMEKIPTLHARIEEIRKAAGYGPGDRLKFETKARPTGVTIESATNAKREVVAAAIESGCVFIAYVVLHAIAKNQGIDKTIQFGANTVIAKFNSYLGKQKSHGIVAMDRLPKGKEFDYLSEKFTKGLSLPKGDDQALDRIMMFSSTCINASHMSSVMDIVLGTWRYCINQPKNADAAKDMMIELVKLIWHTKKGEDILALELGLLLRPLDVKHPPYQTEYDVLLGQINKLLSDA